MSGPEKAAAMNANASGSRHSSSGASGNAAAQPPARRGSQGQPPAAPRVTTPAAGKPSDGGLYTLDGPRAQRDMNVNIMNVSADGWQPQPPRAKAHVRRDPITHKVDVYARGSDAGIRRLDTLSSSYLEALKAAKELKEARRARPKGVSEFVDLSACCVSHENPVHKRALSADRRAFHRKRSDLKAQDGPAGLVREILLNAPSKATAPNSGEKKAGQRPASASAAGSRRPPLIRAPAAGMRSRPDTARPVAAA
mmetsp:Transcript_21216/g.49139  ORF Transcript_21216/g.49139 Transcript_21216/m.49139 type:complete len:253 (+) Transcript_21216:76-834(+)